MSTLEENPDLTTHVTKGVPQNGNVTSRDSNAQSGASYNEIQESLGLQPTTIVLAKVKGYRPWPAMVLEETILPENIKKIKPKTVRLEKKTTQPVINLPVRFFSDDTYIWIKSCDLKILNETEISEFLRKRAKQKKHDLLIDAYRLAQDPPDMEEFNTWGSAGPQEAKESPEPLEPEKKKLKLSIKLKNGSKTTAKSSKITKKPVTKKTQRKAARSSTPRKAQLDLYNEDDIENSDEELSEVDALDLDGYDSDWGLGGLNYNYETGDYIFEDEAEQAKFDLEFPAVADLEDQLNEYNDKLAKIHEKIASSLVEEIVDDERIIVAQLRNLEKFLASSEMPLVILTKSPLYRVLLLVLHRPKEMCPFESVRRAVKRIFQALSLEPCELTVQDVEKEDEEKESVFPEEEKESEETLITESVKENENEKEDKNKNINENDNEKQKDNQNTTEIIQGDGEAQMKKESQENGHSEKNALHSEEIKED